MVEGICSVQDCSRQRFSRGWCQKHYNNWYRHGSPVRMRPNLEERFWAKVQKGPGCWEWQGCLARGYGQLWGTTKILLAHRFSYELLIGPIPEGLTIDHLCRNCRCVNPAHLEPVTLAENIRRGEPWNVRKTHCPSGHPYDEVNTRHSNGRRKCRACGREYMRWRRSQMKGR